MVTFLVVPEGTQCGRGFSPGGANWGWVGSGRGLWRMHRIWLSSKAERLANLEGRDGRFYGAEISPPPHTFRSTAEISRMLKHLRVGVGGAPEGAVISNPPHQPNAFGSTAEIARKPKLLRAGWAGLPMEPRTPGSRTPCAIQDWVSLLKSHSVNRRERRTSEIRKGRALVPIFPKEGVA